MVAHSNLLPHKLVRGGDRRVWRNHDAARRRNIRLPPHRADLLCGCLIDGPVTGAGDVGPHALIAAAPLIGFKRAGADFRNRTLSVESFRTLHRKTVPELVVQALVPEIAFCIGNPLLQTAMWLDDEFTHVPSRIVCSLLAIAGDSRGGPVARWPRKYH